MMEFKGNHEGDKLYGKTFDSAIFKRMLPYLLPFKGLLFFCFIMMTALSAANLIGPVIIRFAIDENIAQGDVRGLLVRAFTYAIAILAGLALNWRLAVNLERVGQKILKNLRMDLFKKLLYMPIRYYTENPVGRLVARVESDTEAVRVFFTNTTILLVQNLFLLSGILIIMYVTSPPLTLRIMLILPVLFVATLFFMRKVRPMFLEIRKRVADICAFVTESLQGMRVIQSFEQRARVAAAMDEENKKKFNTQFPAERLVIFFYNGIWFTEYFAIGIILLYGCEAVLTGVITVGILWMFIQYIEQLYWPIKMLSDQINIMQRAFAAGERIFEILGGDPEVRDPERPREWTLFTGEIRFNDVWFAYSEEKWVLKGISFTVPKGKDIALVGPTGGGKSTIIALLLRFYDPQKGTITVDGIDIRDIPQKELRSKFSLVQQDIFLFPGTVLDNLRLMDERISEDKVWEALEYVQAAGIIARLAERNG